MPGRNPRMQDNAKRPQPNHAVHLAEFIRRVGKYRYLHGEGQRNFNKSESSNEEVSGAENVE